MDYIIKRVKDFIILNDLIHDGDVVGCALSGGADSIFMTYILNKLSLKMNFRILAVHVNHLLRGEDSYLDEDFSKKFCVDNNIEFKSFRFDVLKYSKDKKISFEMGGREVRYNVFFDLKKKGIITKCALAHHADDDVETILMRIFRGTGIDGIEGIKAIRDDFYIRPILFLRRYSEIERYLKEKNIPFIIDQSNLSHDYLRNKLRLSIIPNINESFSCDISDSVLSLKEICSYDNEFFFDLVKKYFNKYVKISNGDILLNKESLNLPKAVLYRLIRHCIFVLNGNVVNINLKHIKDVESLFLKPVGKKIQLKKDLYCINLKDYIKFSNYINENFNKEISLELLNENEILQLKNGDLNSIEKQVLFKNKKVKFEISRVFNRDFNFNLKCEKYFSIDDLNNSVVLRNRRIGDKFKPFGSNRYKKLKDFLINEKASNKDDIPLICFDSNIVWVFKIRNSDDYKVLDNSLNIVKIKIEILGDYVNDG